MSHKVAPRETRADESAGLEAVRLASEHLARHSPMFAASLGNRELFHSNMLAWATQMWPERMACVWSRLIKQEFDIHLEDITVQREYQNFDLWISGTNSDDKRRIGIVVEIKMRSLATEDQLKKYQAKIGKHKIRGLSDAGSNVRFVLIEYASNPLLETPAGWLRFSFRELAEMMEEEFAHDLKHDYPRQVLDDYILMLQLLDEVQQGFSEECLVDEVPYKYRAKFLEQGQIPKKMQDVFEKLHHASLGKKVRDAIDKSARIDEGLLVSSNSDEWRSSALPRLTVFEQYRLGGAVELLMRIPFKDENGEIDDVVFSCAVQNGQFREIIVARHLPRNQGWRAAVAKQFVHDAAQKTEGREGRYWFGFEPCKWAQNAEIQGKGQVSSKEMSWAPVDQPCSYGLGQNGKNEASNPRVVFYKYKKIQDDTTNRDLIETFVSYAEFLVQNQDALLEKYLRFEKFAVEEFKKSRV